MNDKALKTKLKIMKSKANGLICSLFSTERFMSTEEEKA